VSRHADSIAGRLSLRELRRDSPGICARVAEIVNFAEKVRLGRRDVEISIDLYSQSL